MIVGITEADIQDLDHYPISDRLLAQVLSQILALNPVVVGLGLFRDVPVNYGETRRDVPVERLTVERLLVDKSETSIVGADLAILVGAGLATIVGAGLGIKFRYSPITEQRNPPSPPITYQQNPPSPPITFR